MKLFEEFYEYTYQGLWMILAAINVATLCISINSITEMKYKDHKRIMPYIISVVNILILILITIRILLIIFT